MIPSTPSEQRIPEAIRPRPEIVGHPVLVEPGTGVFCRNGCPRLSGNDCSRTAFPSEKEALEWGYNPCPECRPMDVAAVGNASSGEHSAVALLMRDIAADPVFRIRERGLMDRGLDAERLAGLYRKAYGLSFQDFLRMRRLNHRFGAIRFLPEDAASAAGCVTAAGRMERAENRPDPGKTRTGPIVVSRLDTPLGPMTAAASDKGICLLEFAERRMMETQLERLETTHRVEVVPGTSPLFALLADELKAYFRRELREFTVPLDIRGTAFQVAVWEGLRRIRWGEIRSYSEQAKALGRPEAVRAVARANGDNRIAVIIPCHRVVGADGSLTGYGGKLWRKGYLLRLESGQGELFE